ncbi:MAG TPA: S4 domain-containing protein, partial [Actinomycetota bacterium]
MTRRRLDTELVRRGLASSRAEAQEAVRAGVVLVAGSPATKAATMVADDQPVTLSAPARRFVSRGGDKLDAAL